MKWLLGLLALVPTAVFLIGGSPVPVQTLDPDEALLRMFPADSGGVFFFDAARLRDVALLDGVIADQLGAQIPGSVEEFTTATGVDPLNDVQQVLMGRSGANEFLSVVRVNVDPGRVGRFLEDRGASAETYGSYAIYEPDADSDVAIAFAADDIVILGRPGAVRGALDRMTAGPSALDNPELMAEIASIEEGSQFWGVGHFADLMPADLAPPVAADLITALEGIRYQMRLDAGIAAKLAGTFATPETAMRAGDLLRGFVALGKMGSAQEPDMIELLDGFQIRNQENRVEVDFTASQELLDRIAASIDFSELPDLPELPSIE